MTEQGDQSAKNDVLRAQLHLREVQLARQAGGVVKPEPAVSELIRLGVSGPYEGVVDIFSCATGTRLLLPTADIDLLIESLRWLGRAKA